MENTSNNSRSAGFDALTPDIVLSAVENAAGINLTGLITPFPSYINRVFELETDSGERIVAKFYRPGRWSKGALQEEHDFLADCRELDIPVINPLKLHSGSTLGYSNSFFFALFPKKAGRLFELNSDEDYVRVGSLIGRIHQAGKKREARERTILDPSISTAKDLEELVSGGFIKGKQKEAFKEVTDRILKVIKPLFKGASVQRIHGDCHLGNILSRPESDGSQILMVIDFDDMAVGPPVQDLLLLLPGSLRESRCEFNLLVEGYEQFLPFDPTAYRLVEPLRAMRIIYFLAWCARQIDDFQFRSNFPDWGSESFWDNEILDLKNQLDEIQDTGM